jgi:c-di-GMP-binding flagellar brake protein YcgR
MQRSRYPERRHTVRVSLQIPLTVRCQSPEGDAIYLKASTHAVSANGALIMMAERLVPGQSVRLYNEMTNESVECFVTSVREKRDTQYIGIGFAAPRTNFWHMVFPRAGTRQAVRSSQTGALISPGAAAHKAPQI